MGKQELENVKTSYGLKFMESIKRMNNAVGWKGNETLGESKGNTEKLDEGNKVCKMYWKSEGTAQ
jgi:hypothetical protein